MQPSHEARRLVRAGQKGPNGPLADSITVEARVKGQLVQQMDLPCPEPKALFTFIQQSMAAMATASRDHPKKRLVLAVIPRWKAWVMRYVLRIK
jgi:hypothetical protein